MAASVAVATSAGDNHGAVVNRRASTAGLGDISVLSWNILADCYLQDYDNTGKSADLLSWAIRKTMIVDELITAQPDVMCLQEVEFTKFDSELAPALAEAGYDGLMQNDKKRGKDHPVGVATFWRRSLFALEGACHRSRSMVVVLKELAATGRALAVVNVHLQGDPRACETRVKQLQTSLAELCRKHSHQGLIVCGDFNCPLRASACGSYLAFGAVVPGVLEWGYEVPEKALLIPGHGYSLASVDDLSSAPGERGDSLDPDNPLDVQSFTFCAHPGRPVDGLDQLWYSPASLQVVACRALFGSDKERLDILRGGLPNYANPSDHIPIGAVFNWTAGALDLPDLAAEARTAAAAATAAAAMVGEWHAHGQATHTNSTVATEAGEEGSAPSAEVEDPAAEADALLAACPLDEIQRANFLAATEEIVGLPKKGKPSEEQLAQLKQQKELKASVLHSVSVEARQILTRVVELQKKAKKLEQKRQQKQQQEKRALQKLEQQQKHQSGAERGQEGSGGRERGQTQEGPGAAEAGPSLKKAKGASEPGEDAVASDTLGGGGGGGVSNGKNKGRGKGGGGGGGGGGDKNMMRMSKAMSQILRHGLVDRGIEYRPDGYVKVSDLKAAAKGGLQQIQLEELQTIVKSCTKQRFSLIREGSTWWIRANQGHTVPGIDPEQLLTPVVDASELPCVIHGTYHKFLPSIKEGGLCRMSRNHIHFAAAMPGKDGVISGMRSSCQVTIYVNARAAMELGCRFYRSTNGVILSSGLGEKGIIPSSCFEKIIDNKTGGEI